MQSVVAPASPIVHQEISIGSRYTLAVKPNHKRQNDALMVSLFICLMQPYHLTYLSNAVAST